MLSISLSNLKRNPSPSFTYHLPLPFSSSPYDPKHELSFLLSHRLSSPHLHQIHARILTLGYDQDNLLATKLIGHYQFLAPLPIFHHLHNPNIFPFNAIIRVNPLNAFSFFKTLKNIPLSPNEFTFSFLLKSFFRLPEPNHVRQIHTHVVKSGFDRNPFVKNGLLSVYARAIDDVSSAHQVFDEMPERNGVSCWTLLISGYSKSSRSEKALALFLRMLEQNLRPENDTMVSVLSACASLGAEEIEKWETILLQKLQTFDNDGINDSINIVLVYLYGKCGKIENARQVFDKMSQRKGGASSIVVWNSMIGGCAQNGFPLDALALFRLMVQSSNPKPNHVTMVSVLSACSQVGDLELGKWIHECIASTFPQGILETNPFIATAFIDMYAKCGSVDNARKIFYRMVKKDVVSFNAMIMGLAINGHGEEALGLFSTMQSFDACPNDGTFIGVLCACTHAGLVSEGRIFFASMEQRYSITPKVEHYACFIDLLARADHVEEALEVVKSMSVDPNVLVWGAVLNACLIHSKLDLAIDVARKLVDIDPENSGAYVLLSNVYAEDSRWDEIVELRTKMKRQGVRKQPGCSWISVDGVVHEFLVGSTLHPEFQRMHHTLNVLFNEMRLVGYMGEMPIEEWKDLVTNQST